MIVTHKGRSAMLLRGFGFMAIWLDGEGFPMCRAFDDLESFARWMRTL